MCRLAIISGIKKAEPLATALTQLEKSMGGDGNGVWNSESGQLFKGVHLTTEEIAEEIAGKPGYNIFHTRMSTAGGVKSEICHPFEAGEWVVAHNGHWSGWYSYSEGTISDTQTAAKLVEEYGPGVLLNREFDHSGVWIVGAPEGAFLLHRGWNNFYLQPLKYGGMFHASEGIKNYARSGVYMVPKNSIHFITDDDVYETTLEVSEMPEPLYDIAEFGYGGGKYGYDWARDYGTTGYTSHDYGRNKETAWSGVYSYDDTFDFDEKEWDRFERELVEGNVDSWRQYVEMRKAEKEITEKEAGAYEDDDLGVSAKRNDLSSGEQLALTDGSDD